MIILFIHQNYPGQYKHLVQHYAGRPSTRVIFITQSQRPVHVGVEKIIYEMEPGQPEGCHPYAADFDRAVRTGAAVARVCRKLAWQGVRPDMICGHNGWGEMLYVKDVFADTPVLSYFEFYYHAQGVDVDFDPEFNSGVDPLRLRSRNAVHLLGLDAADWGNTPTRWQRSVHPPEFRSRLSVLHEGVDTDVLRPDPAAQVYLQRDHVLLERTSEVVTYVARNLEPYRGFHIFMRAACEVLRRRPQARIVVVGGDEVSYGNVLSTGLTYRQTLLKELNGSLDLSRLHFVGRLPYATYVRLLQLSSVHVYLTYPFVLSWSLLEAMSCGCAIVGSDTPPVMEVLRDGQNGIAVDFFSPQGVAEAVLSLLDRREAANALGGAARDTILARYDWRGRQAPRWEALICDLREGRRPALFPEDEDVGLNGWAPR